MKKTNLDATATACDINQLADAMCAPGVEILFTLDQGALRCVVCHGAAEGDFLVLQDPVSGDGFIVQGADIGESVHDHARAVLTATY